MHTKTLERTNLIYVAAVAIMAGLIIASMPLMSQAKNENNGNNATPGGLYCYLPFGHLIAPGYEKTHGTLDRSNDPICVTLPQGINKKIDDNLLPEDSEDTTPPEISDVEITDIASTTATVTWRTDEPATSKVYYGSAASFYTAMSSSTNDSSPALANYEHSVTLEDLSASTTYRFWVESMDRHGNVATSSQYTFVTDSGDEDNEPPKITEITVTDISSSTATVSWKTDEPADSKVLYGEGMFYSHQMSTSTLTMEHSLTLTELKADTEYNFRVRSEDADGNFALSLNTTFTTLKNMETTSPFIKEGNSGKKVEAKEVSRVRLDKEKIENEALEKEVKVENVKKEKPKAETLLLKLETN